MPLHRVNLITMASFEATVRTQVDLHHRISYIYENLKKLGKKKITLTTINTRIEALEAKWEAFRLNHFSLVSAQTEELRKHSYFANDFYDMCETAYFANKDNFLGAL
jgi:hypothetical protein